MQTPKKPLLLYRILPTLTIPLLTLLILSCSIYTNINNGAENKSAIIKSQNDYREYKSIKLENNLDVILATDSNIKQTAVSITLPVGHYQNPRTQPGLAHYLEHMLFLGTDSYPKPNSINKFIKSNGGKIRATTSFNQTNFALTIQSTEIETALDMFSDLFKTPRFDKKYSQKELHSIDAEWSNARTNSLKTMEHLDGLTGNPKHPASLFGAGNFETLLDKNGSTLYDELVKFYETYYSANIMSLAMVSNLDLSIQENLVRKYFHDVKDKGVQIPVVSIPRYTQNEIGKKIFYSPAEKDIKAIMISFELSNTYQSWKYKPYEYIFHLLKSNDPGTIATMLQEAGMITSLQARIRPKQHSSSGRLEIMTFLTDKGMGSRDEIIASIFSYLQLIKKKGVNKKYFEELKSIEEQNFQASPPSSPIVSAVKLSTAMQHYPKKWLLSYPYYFERFSPKVITEALDSLKPENSRIWYISQYDDTQNSIPHFKGKYSIKNISKEDIDLWNTISDGLKFELPQKNSVVSTINTDTIRPRIFTPKLINNTPHKKVWLAHSKAFQTQKGRIDILLNSNAGQGSIKKKLLSKLFVRTLKHQLTPLANKSKEENSPLKLNYKNNSLSISLQGFSVNHRKVMNQISKHLQNWNLSDVEFNNARKALQRDFDATHQETPLIIARDYLKKKTFDRTVNYTKKSELLNSLQKEDLLEFKKRYFSNSDIKAFAFGNYNEESVLAVVSELEKALPLGRIKQPIHAKTTSFIPNPGEFIQHNISIDHHTDSAIVDFYISPDGSAVKRAEIIILRSLIHSEFFTQLRTKEQLGYIVGTTAKHTDLYPGIILYIQSSSKTPSELKYRIETFRSSFFHTLENMDANSIDKIINKQKFKLTRTPSSFSEEEDRLFKNFYNENLHPDPKQELIEAFNRIDKSSLLQTYKELFINNRGARNLIQIEGSNSM